MSDWTPSTEQVRSHYVFNQSNQWDPERGEAFDRWLVEHDRQVAERAWDEGYEAAAGFHEGREKGHWENDFPAKGMRMWRPDPAPTSPYRKEQENNNA